MVGRVILAALLGAGLVAAQPGGGGGMGGGGARGGMGGMGMPGMQQSTKADQLAEKLKLSKEQKDQVGAILKAAAESAAPLGQQLDVGRQKMTQAMVHGKDSGEDYNKLLAAITEVQVKLDGIEAKAYGDIYALLKPNQQKSGEQVFTEVMAGMFASPVGPGGGRRRGQ